MVFHIEIVPFWIASCLSIGLAVYSFKRPSIQGAKVFGYMMIAVTVWLMSYSMDLASTGLAAKTFWLKFKYFGSLPSSVLWLHLCLHLTDNKRWITPTFNIVAWGWVAVTLIVVWTNPWHELFWPAIYDDPSRLESATEHGPLFSLYSIPGGGVVPVSIVIFAAYIVTAPPFYRARAIVLMIAGALPVIGRGIALAGYEIVPGVDQVPLMLVFSSVIYATAIFSFQALDVLRVAQSLVIDNVEVGVLVVDHQGNILGINPYAANIFPNAHINLPLSALPALRDRALEDNDEFEIEVIDDHSHRYFLVKVSELENQRVGQLGVALILLDITERTLADTALKRSIEARSRFFTNVSHELRTPLHGISGLLELLGRTDLNDEQLSYLKKANASARVLRALIDDVLDLSRAESPQMEMGQRPFTLDSVLENVRSFIDVRAQEAGLEFIVQSPGELPRLMGDPLRLTQILTNLAGNSVKFTKQGSITLVVEQAAQVIDESLSLKFTVTDTGVGISDEQMTTLFDAFVQGDNSTTEEFAGTGLGLAISRELVRAMGGDIDVNSSLGNGSTFSFTIQLEIAEPVAEDSSTNEEPIQPITGAKVLVIDDAPINRQVAEELLMQAGCSVTVADSGSAAIEALRSTSFDVILMDIQMPGIDGYETTTWLRSELNLKTPIVAVTAGAGEEERQKALAVGMDGMIPKPFESHELYRTVSTHLKAKPALDDGGAEKYLRGNEQRYRELLIELVEELEAKFAGIESMPAEELQRLMHEVKGSTGFLGALELASITADFESQLMNGADAEDLNALESLRPALKKLKEAVDQL